MDAKSIFQRCFHGRRRCRIVRSLLDCLAEVIQPRLVTSPQQRQEPCSGPPTDSSSYRKCVLNSSFKLIGKSTIHHLRISHNTPRLPPKFLQPFVSYFSWLFQSSQERLKAMLTQNFGWLTRCIVRDVQMANGYFDRPFVVRTQLLVDLWGPEQRSLQVLQMDLTRAWV